MKVTLKDSEGGVAHLYFPEDQDILIGSDANCALHIQDLRLPSECAKLVPAGEEEWSFERVDPHLPMYVNRKLVKDPLPVRTGDEVLIQEYELRCYLGVELDEQEEDDDDQPTIPTEDLAKIKEYPLPKGASVRRRFDHLNIGPALLDAASRAAIRVAPSRDPHEFIEEVLELLMESFDARAAWVGLRRQPKGELDVVGSRLSSGETMPTNPVHQMMRYRCVERSQFVHVRKVRDHDTIGTALGAPVMMGQKNYGMIYVDRTLRGTPFQAGDLDLLSLIASQIAAKHEDLLQVKQQRDATLSDMHITLMHEIQEMLDPKNPPMWNDYGLAAYSRSGQINPGDVYDVMKHPDLNVTAFLIAHVNATSAALALTMSRLQATFRVGFLHKDRMHALARTQNWLMTSEKDPSTIDAIFLMFDPATGKLEYTRCGKMGAVIVDGKGQPRGLPGDTAPAIGQTANFEYPTHIEQLNPGDTLGLYTRGVATCTDGEGKKFSELRFLETICDSFGESPAAILEDLSTDLTTFFADGTHPDDITIMLLQRGA